ncbi:MAG: hypothetical protein H6727_05925 [Myxococcales bacterium]|nr:hypothetical protein [Myxococcales bacterium]
MSFALFRQISVPTMLQRSLWIVGVFGLLGVGSAHAVPAKDPKPLRKRTMTYDIFFRGSKAGELVREELTYPAGRVVVFNRSSFKVSYMFFRMEGANRSRCDYKDGKLVKFRVYAKVRGKESKSWGKAGAKKIVIHRQTGKDPKTVTKNFAYKDFQSTSLDLIALPPKYAVPGKSLKRKVLRIDQLKLVDQELRVLGTGSHKINGKDVPIIRVEMKGPRGKGTMLVAKEGFMIQTAVKSFMASFEMKLRSLREG